MAARVRETLPGAKYWPSGSTAIYRQVGGLMRSHPFRPGAFPANQRRCCQSSYPFQVAVYAAQPEQAHQLRSVRIFELLPDQGHVDLLGLAFHRQHDTGMRGDAEVCQVLVKGPVSMTQ